MPVRVINSIPVSSFADRKNQRYPAFRGRDNLNIDENKPLTKETADDIIAKRS